MNGAGCVRCRASFVFHARIFEAQLQGVLYGAWVHGLSNLETFKEVHRRFVQFVILSQRCQALGRQEQLTVFAPFALVEMDAHAGGIHFGDLELTAFFQPYACRVEQFHERPLLNGFTGLDKRHHFPWRHDVW